MIQIRKISTEYDGKTVLKDVDLSVREGDFVALCGGDDAGKTALLHILMGFNTSYSGRVFIMGSRPNNLSAEQRARVRFIPDDIIWERQLTAEDYFALAREASQTYDMKLQNKLCKRYEIPLYNKMLNMTYKENKLVQIIGAISARPRLLILDEPKNFLDKRTYRMLLEELVRLNRTGTTILMAVEKYSDAAGYCSHYAYLKEGQLAASGRAVKRTRKSKIVTARGGDIPFLKKHMERCIRERKGEIVFLYKGDPQMLLLFLYKADCEDWSVEDLTLEEELDRNFERWE
ncbi:MAG: ATP-binding cassette domain-containing protein [Lachnospiraceae bacterium]|nr:ATP-binding cassette domain-containing protein [Lachnospiraceae bacterium]